MPRQPHVKRFKQVKNSETTVLFNSKGRVRRDLVRVTGEYKSIQKAATSSSGSPVVSQFAGKPPACGGQDSRIDRARCCSGPDR
jgi:hypothetical protein